MNQLASLLTSLPPDGIRLESGLALRLSKGHGMAVLGVSRLGVSPTDAEMALVYAAIQQAFAPSVLLQADKITLYVNRDGRHFIRRLYWPLEDISPVRLREQPVQIALF
ncbi:MAG: hypothetical protein KJ063_24810 [Anaerolineae bacterium]|nr:hypothetical protein [Anaerolineae bacterium]